MRIETVNDLPKPIYLTIKQTAAALALSPWTLYRWISSGLLNERTGLRTLGKRRRRIDLDALRAAIERGELNV